MRTVFSVVLGLVFLAILGGIGVSIYNAGVSAGLAQSGAVAGGAVAPYIHAWGFRGAAGFGFGFGLLGLIFPILFLFLIFGLIRAAIFGGRRSWGHGGYGWHGDQGPDGWRGGRERYLADLHRRLHEEDAGNATGSAGSGGSGRGSGPGSPGGAASGPGETATR